MWENVVFDVSVVWYWAGSSKLQDLYYFSRESGVDLKWNEMWTLNELMKWKWTEKWW